MKRFAWMLIWLGLLLIGSNVHAQTICCTYDSTTTVSGSAGSGQSAGGLQGELIYISVSSSWDSSDCTQMAEEPPTYSGNVEGGIEQDVPEDPNFYSVAAFGPGTYTIGGSFSGYTGFSALYANYDCVVQGSSSTSTVTVPGPASSSMTVPASAITVRQGQTISIPITVAGNYDVGPTPTGKIVLFNGTTILATSSSIVAVPNSDPVAASTTYSLTSTGVPPGT